MRRNLENGVLDQVSSPSFDGGSKLRLSPIVIMLLFRTIKTLSITKISLFPVMYQNIPAFRRDSSSKSETDESCARSGLYGVGAPVQELQYGFALQSLSVVSHCHPATEYQI
ncbi:hypothetical protein TNCV_3798231 [Trichonephila clavipes]|nr:hypothetical protein TNCV_3798231 [Trichonephila clavipes]